MCSNTTNNNSSFFWVKILIVYVLDMRLGTVSDLKSKSFCLSLATNTNALLLSFIVTYTILMLPFPLLYPPVAL